MRLSVFMVGCCFFLTGCIYPTLDVVDNVEVERYMGTWYEIARYPNWFQGTDCVGTTAEYTLRDDDRVTVVNQCYKGSLDGSVQSIEGIARVVDPETNAKLKVSFFGPFEGNYWIVDLDSENYQWAVVGEPTRSTLWILSRTPQMDDAVYEAIISRLPDKLYDPDRLMMTTQPEN